MKYSGLSYIPPGPGYRFSGFKQTGYNVTSNLSKKSRVAEHVLAIKGIDTKNKNDYRYIFGDKRYDNKSIVTRCRYIGDPTENRDIYYVPGFNFLDDTMTSYKDLYKVLIEIEKKVNSISDNSLYIQALNHYKENILYKKNITSANIEIAGPYGMGMSSNVENPYSVSEANDILNQLKTNTPLNSNDLEKVKKISIKYLFLMVKIGKKGLTIDDYLNNAIYVRKVMAENIPEAIKLICPDFDKFNEEKGKPPLKDMPEMINLGNNSFLAIKYGVVDTLEGPRDLFSYFKVNKSTYSDPDVDIDEANPSQGYNTMLLPFDFIKLREIVGFSYNNISCLLNVFCHEFAHQIGAGVIYDKDHLANFPLGIQFSPQSLDILNQVFNKNIIVKAFEINTQQHAQLQTSGAERGKDIYSMQAFEGLIFGEFLADFIGLVVLEKYVDTLPDIKSKYEAIVNATAWSCSCRGNIMEVFHPPNSMRTNLIFLSKKLHDIYNTYMSFKKGGTRRKNKQYRKSTYRRRR